MPPLVLQPSSGEPSDTKRSPISLNHDNTPNDDRTDPKSGAADIHSQTVSETPEGNPGTNNLLFLEETTPTIMPTCSSEHQCCSQYEFCVSSCMSFIWQRIRDLPLSPGSNSKSNDLQSVERLLGDHQADDTNVSKEYSEATDLFDWCLLRCRTSGRSVVHQNSFRSTLKYCYGLKDPPLLARNVEKGETE